MAGAPVKGERLGSLDTTQIHEIYKWHVHCLDRGDVGGLSEIYHDEAVVIVNRELSCLMRTPSALKGGRGVTAAYEAYVGAGIGQEKVWDYVQGNNAFIVRSRVNVRGVEQDLFGYYVIRDGKIWRHVRGLEAERTRSVGAQVDFSKMHPFFAKLSEGLVSSNPDEMLKFYAKDCVALWASNKSFGFRIRGSAQGHEEIRAFLAAYMDGGGQVAELKDYIEEGDLVYSHALMSRSGVVSESYGAWVLGATAGGGETATESQMLTVAFSST